jgi:hypothetical protein
MTAIRAEQVGAMGPNAVGKCQTAAGSKPGSSGSGAQNGAAGQAATAGGAAAAPGAKSSGGSAASSGQPPGKPVVVVDPNKAGWLLIELLDESGAPVVGEPFRVKLPNGKTVEGNLDEQGAVRIEGVDEAKCKVSFPQRDDAGWQSA